MESKVSTGARGTWKVRRLAVAVGVAAALTAAGAAHAADTLGVFNNAAFGNGPVETDDLTTHTFVNQYIPDWAQSGSNSVRAVIVPISGAAISRSARS